MDGPAQASERLSFGVFEVNVRTGELRKAGTRIAIQDQPFRILVRLLERPGQMVTREELRQELWPADTFVDFDHGLNAAVKRLRDALGDSAETPRFIETLPRRGYRFAAPVQSASNKNSSLAISATETGGPARGRRWLFIGAGDAAAALAGAAARWVQERVSPRNWEPQRFNLALPSNVTLPEYGTIAITRAGDRVFFLGVERDGSTRVYVRQTGREDARPVPGTDGAFFSTIVLSPDEQWLGFLTDDSLMKIPSDGGTPVRVADIGLIGPAREIRGVSWGADGTILIGPAYGGLFKVRADGGVPEPPTTLDPKGTHLAHRWPSILPGGRLALFSTMTASALDEDREVCLLDLSSGQWRVLFRGGQYPQFSPSGHILYARQGSILAVPFNAVQGRITGAAAAALHDVQSHSHGWGLTYFAVSDTGSAVYVPGTPNIVARRLVWVDRRGVVQPVADERRPYSDPRLSPDGRRLVVSVGSGGIGGDLWTFDLSTGQWSGVTSDGDAQSAVWSPDGSRLAFSARHKGPPNIYSIPSDGHGAVDRLTRSTNWHWPLAFSPDGLLYFSDRGASGGGLDIGVLFGRDPPRPFLATRHDESAAVPSPPDGRWVAYVSRRSGTDAVYISAASTPTSIRWSRMDTEWNRRGRAMAASCSSETAHA